MLDDRPEGLYVNPVPYRPELGETALTRIERVNGDMTVTSIIATQIEVVHLRDRLRELQCDQPRVGSESREHAAMRESVAGCVRRLLEIGLPDKMALHARDAVLATAENLLQRQRCGEWEPR